MHQISEPSQSGERAEALDQSITATLFLDDWRLSALNLGVNERKPFRVKLPGPAPSKSSLPLRIDGKIYNLSAEGCSIRLTYGTVCPGDDVWFRIESITPWRGTVRWANAVNVGVEFERTLFQSQFELVAEMRKLAEFSRVEPQA